MFLISGLVGFCPVFKGKKQHVSQKVYKYIFPSISPVILAHILAQPHTNCNIFGLWTELFYNVSRTTNFARIGGPQTFGSLLLYLGEMHYG